MESGISLGSYWQFLLVLRKTLYICSYSVFSTMLISIKEKKFYVISHYT